MARNVIVTRFLLTVGIIFVAVTVLGYAIHGVLLGADYRKAAGLFREQPALYFLFLANLVFSFAVVWLHTLMARTATWVLTGFRLGVVAWLLWAVPSFLIQYAAQPLPGGLVAKQIGLELVDMLLIGMFTARLLRDTEKESSGHRNDTEPKVKVSS